MHPKFRVLALSLALAGAAAPVRAAERDDTVSDNRLALISTSTQGVTAGMATVTTEGHALTLTNGGAGLTVLPSVACYAPDGMMVTPTAKGCPGFDTQPMALDDPDLSPVYFGKTLDVQTSHQSLLADLARYKGDQVVLYLSSGRSLGGVLTDVDWNHIGFRLASGMRLKIDPGRVEGFGESGD